LIEDNPSDVDLTRRALERSRISNELAFAEDGEAALKYLWREGPELPAIALLDLNLPKLSGLRCFSRFGPVRTRRLPVVILTSSRRSMTSAGYDLGVNSYIRKPVDFSSSCIEHGLYWLVLNEQPPAVR
jgi:CheY-like chemotaxis protein